MKPGATTMPRASIRRFAAACAEIADRRDPPVADADVARVPGRAGAVDDVAVVEDEVERGVGGEGGDGQEEEGHEDDLEFHGDPCR